MSITVGVYDAKTQLPKLLQAVEAGETVTITRHGKPIAELGPVREHALTPAEAVARMRAMSRRMEPRPEGGPTIKEMIEEGRM